MNKLQMAHEYALQLSKNPSVTATHDDKDIVSRAWQYADEMQAEADKRECKERTDVLLTKDKDGNCLHFHHEFGHKKCMDCGASLEEWQPDWSQAPMGFNRFVVGSDGGYGFFTNMEPQLQDDFWFVGADGIVIKDHGYQGSWQDSLRKRPQ